MRGGAALVGEATPVTLLDRWTRPGGAATLLVGEYEGAVVGLLGVTVAAESGGRRSGLIECCYVETGARGVGRGHGADGGRGRLERRAGVHRRGRTGAPGGPRTKQRLEAAGFTARLLTLSRRLG